MLLLSITLNAQLFKSETIATIDNNESVSVTKKLFIDTNGFLWYSTLNGVVKEMGNQHQFFPFNLPKNHPEVKTTYNLFMTSKQEMLSLTSHGINILDLKNTTSTWLSVNYPNTNEIVQFTSIIEDINGILWIGTLKNYIYSYTKEKGLKAFKVKDSLSLNKYKHEAECSFKMETSKGLIYEQGHEWFLFKDYKSKLLFNEKSYSNNKSFKFKIIPNGLVFPQNQSGVYEFREKKFNYLYLKEFDLQLIQFPFDNEVELINDNNKIYFATNVNSNFNLFIIEELNNIFKLKLEHKYNTKKRITNFKINNENEIFIHNFSGIVKLKHNVSYFNSALNLKYNEEEISCRSIVENTNGDIYVLTYSGVFKKNKKENKWYNIINLIGVDVDQKIRNNCYGMVLTKPNELLFYGHEASFIKVDLITGASQRTYLNKDLAFIKDIVLYKGYLLLLSSKNGLDIYNNKTNRIISNTKINIPLTDLFIDKSNLIIATENEGILVYDLETNSLKKVIKEENGLVNNAVKIIYKDENNFFWIGTKNGLQKLDSKFKPVHSFTNLNGLINDHVIEIQEDQDHIWAATYNGLVKIEKKTHRIKTYLTKNGLPHNEFNSKSSLKSSDSIFYFGGLNGVISFKNEKQKENRTKRSLFLTSYKYFNKDLDKNVEVYNLLNQVPEFILPYNKNYITLTFALNDIVEPNKNIYQYKIKEISDSWVDLGSYNKVVLEGLQPDNYTLNVRGFSSDGLATNTLTYNIVIERIFYKKAWFIILIACLLIGTAYWFASYRNRKLRQLFSHKTTIQYLEAKAMRAQMNPHFIFNTLNGMQSVMILKGEREANKYFIAFSKLLRLTLDINNSDQITLKDEITYLHSYLELENLRLNHSLNYTFNIDQTLDIKGNKIPCMMLQPIIENAIIHGLIPKKDNLTLEVNIINQDLFIKIEIIDNGIGREASTNLNAKNKKGHKSWATHIMNERIYLSNEICKEKIEFSIEDLKDKNNKSLGTKVVLIFPKTLII